MAHFMGGSDQMITQPHGISVFGSSITSVRPDLAEVEFAVGRVHAHPQEAFDATRIAARAVSEALSLAGVAALDLGMSQAGLEDAWSESPHSKRIGYVATIRYRVLVRNLDALEPLMVAAVAAGANEITRVRLHTRRLNELRVEARRRAIENALAKATQYADAAGVQVGTVLHIEDQSPTVLQREVGRHRESSDDGVSDAPPTATVPGSIEVAAAVVVSYAILPRA